MSATVHTWADGFGVWHARVEGASTNLEARNVARGAIREELVDRGESPNFRLELVVVDDVTLSASKPEQGIHFVEATS